MKNKKVVKFKEVKIGQVFYLPNYQRRYDSPFTKINELTYADNITKLCYWDDGAMHVEIQEEKENKPLKRRS